MIYFDDIALKCEGNITLTLEEKKKYFWCSHTPQNKPAFVHHQGQETFWVTTLLKWRDIRNCLCVAREVWQIILEISKYPLKQLNSQMPRNSVPNKHRSWTCNLSCKLGIYCSVCWSLVRDYCQKQSCFQRLLCLLQNSLYCLSQLVLSTQTALNREVFMGIYSL